MWNQQEDAVVLAHALVEMFVKMELTSDEIVANVKERLAAAGIEPEVIALLSRAIAAHRGD